MAQYYTDFSDERLGTLTEHGYNLALKRSGTTTSSARYTDSMSSLDYALPDQMVDGSTHYSSYVGISSAGEEWLQVDLGEVQTINAVRVWHYWKGERSYYSPKTAVSEDGINWTVVSAPSSYSETSAGNLRTFAPIKARYVRDYVNGSSANTSAHWVELDVYGYPTTTPNWKNRIPGASNTSTSIIPSSSGNIMKMNTGSGGSYVNSYTPLDGVQDVESVALFRIVDTGQGGRFGILYNRYSGTSEATTKGFNVNFTPASDVKSIFIVEDSTGVIAYTSYEWALNTWYYMRFRTVGDRVATKIWAKGSTEPTSWLMDVNYSGPSIPSPYSGVGHFVQNSSIEYDYYAAATDGGTAPLSPPPVPTSTPQIGYSGGYGSVSGYGQGYGMGTKPSAQNIVVTANDSKSSHSVNNINITQKHSTPIASSSHTHKVNALTVTQVHNTPIASTKHTLVTTSPALLYNVILLTNSANHSLKTTSPELLDEYIIPVQSSLIGITSNVVDLDQRNNIDVKDSSHTVKSTLVNLTEDWTLQIASAAHETLSESLYLLQDYLIPADDTNHLHDADNVRLHQYAVLLTDSASHVIKSDTFDINQYTLLPVPDSGLFEIITDIIPITQKHELYAEDSLMNITDYSPHIMNWVDYGKYFGNYGESGGNNGTFNTVSSESSGAIIGKEISSNNEYLTSDVERGYYSNVKYGTIKEDID